MGLDNPEDYGYGMEVDFSKEIDLSKYEGDDRIVSSTELKEELKDKYKNIVYYKSKFPTMNELIGGFLDGDLTVISGITGNGKTLFCQSLIDYFHTNKIGSLVFTYEVPTLQFLYQFGEPMPHFFMPKILKKATLKWIEERIKEAIIKYKIKAVFIDHLHYLADIMISKSPSLEIGQVMRTLKGWSRDLEIMIFIVAHMGKIQSNKEPDSGDTRDSSFVEQEADNVFYIWRSLKKDNEAILKITKNRSRGIMNKKIKLIKQGKYLVELSKLPDINDLDIDTDSFGQEE